MIFKVQKKDGSIENFSSKKIERAVSLASERIGKTLSTKEVKKIIEIVKSHLVHEVTNIVDMHKIVCNAIKEVDHDTATSYQSYRDYKTTYAKDFEKLFQQAKDVLLLGDRENANFDSALISTKGSLIRRYLTKMLYNRFYNQKDFYNELVLGTIYQHDASEAILNSINCLKGDTWVTIRVDGKQETITLNCLKNKLNLEKGLYSLNGNIQILSHTGWTPLKGISIRSLKKEEPIYFLKTRNGLGLKATANHRIPVIDQNGKNVLKEVKDIVIGDNLIMPDKNFLEKDYENKKILYRNPDKILNIHQIFEENYENILVYDLMTGDEHFIANGYIVHNCCLFDIFTVLKGGFEMNNIRYSEPNSVLTALQVIGDITLVATAQQFGGFTLPEIDRCLVPYCKKTLEKARKEIQEFSTNATHEEVEKFARNRLKRELEQGIQGIELKLNTVPCSRGDFAFVTFTFGAMPKDATEEEKDIQRLVAKTLLEVRMKGHHGVPVVFPKLVYLYAKDQHKDPKQKALFQVALECSSTTMYPDYLAIDSDYGTVSRIYKESGVITSPMGCRAFLSPWKDPKTNQYVTIGRANIGAVSLHLPLIWEVAKYNHGGNATKEYFYEYLDNCMDLIRNFFKRKYETLSNTYCSTNPMGFTQGGFYHGVKKPTEKIGDLVKYMTASFGITALHELTEVALGKSLKEDKSTFAKEVVQHIADRVKKYKSEDGWLYALYGTPAESLCETQAKQLKKFYIDTNQPEKAYQVADYLTNSFHFHVSEKISPFEKQDGEFDLFHMIEGGHIQYCRIDDPTNIKGLEDIVLRAMDMGFYEGVNFEAMFCNDCKKHSVVKPTNISTCPVCGSHATTVISRVCGYLGYSAVNGDTRLNNGKLSEIHDRVSM